MHTQYLSSSQKMLHFSHVTVTRSLCSNRQGPHLTWRSHLHQKVGWGTWLESSLITERDWFQTDQNIDESLETGGLLEVVRAFCKSFEKMFWTFSICFLVDLSCLRRRNRKHKEVLYWRGENKRGTMLAYICLVGSKKFELFHED